MDGHSTSLGHVPLCVYLDSVKSAGDGKSSVEAWFSTSVHMEEVPSGGDLHLFVAECH